MAETQYSFPYHKKNSCNLPSVPRKPSEGVSHYGNSEGVSLGALDETMVPNCRLLQTTPADTKFGPDTSKGSNILLQI